MSAGQFGLDKDCVAKGDEVSLIDKTDIDVARGPLGRLNAEFMDKIVKAVRYAIRCDDLAKGRK